MTKGQMLLGAWITFCVVGGTLWIRSELKREAAATAEQLAEVQQDLTLLRVEQTSKGKGFAAVLEKLRRYAPQLDEAGTSYDGSFLQTQMDDVIVAAGALGRDGIPQAVKALEATQPGKDTQLRFSLLRAIVAMDRDNGLEALAQVVTGRIPNVEVTARLRWMAADQLMVEDMERAGLALRRVLRTESVRGINSQRLKPGEEVLLARGASNRFHNFVARYARTEDPELDATLRMVLDREEHDRITLQRSVEELGKIRSQLAAPRIRELFLRPPGGEPPQIFQGKCLDALALIEGQKLCGFLRERVLAGHHEMVVNRIQFHLNELDCP